MGKMIVGLMRDGLLVLGVLVGPGLCLAGVLSAGAAWQAGSANPAVMLHLLVTSFVTLSCAAWGVVSGPTLIPRRWYGFTSLQFAILGVGIAASSFGNRLPIAVLFLGYSLWHFIEFRRPRVHIVS